MPVAGFGALLKGQNRTVETFYDASATDVSSSSSANTFGSWTELVADIGDRDILIVGLGIKVDNSLIGADELEVQLGLGASSSEVTFFSVTRQGDQGSAFAGYMALSLRVSADSRLSARAKDSNSNAEHQQLHIYYLKL